LLDYTQIQEYLDHVAATQNIVSIADIERYRPEMHSLPYSDRYPEQYNKLLETLVMSFSEKQLMEFTRLYNLKLQKRPKNNRKYYYAATIIEKQWKWPPLSEIERNKRAWKETSSRSMTNS
jgi:hypothetical protein